MATQIELETQVSRLQEQLRELQNSERARVRDLVREALKEIVDPIFAKGGVRIQGLTPLLFANMISLQDGVAEPATLPGYTHIYLDIADGDLKMKDGAGNVATIKTDV